MLISGLLFGQKNTHIKYLNVRSDIANVYEDLYTDGTRVLSKQDGNFIYTNSYYMNSNNKKGRDFYFISSITNDSMSAKNFFFTSNIGNDDYFVHDEIPEFKWNIDEKSTKKILGFLCYKATTTFRGSNFIAYFTKEIPYSIGPFKFFGLPGAILDVRQEGMSYNIWRAEKVDLDYQQKIDFQPEFPNFTKVKMRTFVELKDADRERFSKSVPTPVGSTSQMVKERPWIEKVFEWEIQ